MLSDDEICGDTGAVDRSCSERVYVARLVKFGNCRTLLLVGRTIDKPWPIGR